MKNLFVEQQEEYGSRWDKLNWQERGHKVFETTRSLLTHSEYSEIPSEDNSRIIAANGPEAVCGGLLAGYLGLSFTVANAELTDNARMELQSNSGPLIIVALIDEASDALLLGLLDEFERSLTTSIPWGGGPRFTLITGRDLLSLSWVVAKAIGYKLWPARERNSIRFAHFTPHASFSLMRELRIDDSITIQPTSRKLKSSEVIESITSPADVVAFQTHGSDACARGGDGVVLCGLNSYRVKSESAAASRLACGYGLACPRGPYPVPLRFMPSKVLMLATCNGFRLRDSSLTSDFNLALSFLDGRGLGYIASVFPSMGNEPCSIALLAALASGYPLGEAVAIVNALSFCADIERPAYMTVGLPGQQLLDKAPPTPVKICKPVKDATPIKVNFGHNNFGELIVEDYALVQLAKNRQLSFTISCSQPGDNVYWFYRLEQPVSEDSSNFSEDERLLRVFVFRFPAALGELGLMPGDSTHLREWTLEALNGFARWLELWRISKLAERESETFKQLCNTEREAKELFSRHYGRLKYDGSTFPLLQNQREIIEATSAVTRDWVLEDFLLSMSGPFWLTNVLVAEYHYEGSRETVCPYCSGIAARKTLRHALHSEARIVDVCPRCGIISDIRDEGAIAEVLIKSPDLCEAGKCMEVEVAVRLRNPSDVTSVIVCPRLSVHGLCEILPFPEKIERRITGVEAMHFKFQLPTNLPPHQYSIKLLVATAQDVAFAHKLFFIHDACHT